MLGVFHLVPIKFNILQAAAEGTAESSTGTNFKGHYRNTLFKDNECTCVPA
ncbi:MAG: hypothetical protein R2741_08560 [Methanolobus sp.]